MVDTRHSLALLFLLILTPHALASDQWQLLRDKEGVRVYSQKVSGSRYESFKGVMVLESSLASILGLLDHTEASPEWLHLCVEGKTLKTNGFSERTIYQVIDLPFPFATRDAVYRATTSHNPLTGVFTITLESAADYYPVTKHVRIRISSGYFLLKPIDATSTEVTWKLHIDPAGAMPAFLLNMLLVEIPFKSLRRMAELVRTSPYKHLELKYDAQGNPVELLNRNWIMGHAARKFPIETGA